MLGTVKMRFSCVGFIVLIFVSLNSFADDVSAITTLRSKSNILLVLDYSDSMRGKLAGAVKIDSLRTAVKRVVDTYASDVNIGLGSLFANVAGGIHWPISDLSAPAGLVDPDISDSSITGQDIVEGIVDNTPLEFGTASVPALIEAAQYFRGGPVQQGGVDVRNVLLFKPNVWDPAAPSHRGGDKAAAHPSTYEPMNAYQVGAAPGSVGNCRLFGSNLGTRFCHDLPIRNCKRMTTLDGSTRRVCEYTHSDRWSGADYVSPIKNQCETNNIIFISDGNPFNEGNQEGFEDITGLRAADCADLSISLGDPKASAGICGPELLSYLQNNDMNPSIPGSNITTHTVAFGVKGWGRDYLESLARAGGGEFFNSRTSDELISALENLFENISSPVDNISQFSIGIDRLNASHDDRMYIPLIAPSGNPVWRGNLKGYFMDSEGIKDVTGNAATNRDSGSLLFSETARSFWSSDVDGIDVTAGGASENLDADSRTLYTYIGEPDAIPGSGAVLSANKNYSLSKENRRLNSALFGTGLNHRVLLKDLRELPMGDPLHSDIVIADYDGGQRVLYTATNQGFLHAIDATEPGPGEYNNTAGGGEIFAFMPQELLSNVKYLIHGGFTGEHLYGLDGNIVPWHTDQNGDGIVNGTDKLVLIFGMRRGGSNYYAMDVTNPESPRLIWQISGGQGDFKNLAQSWSRPSLLSVKFGSESRKVLAFGGGYDDTNDDIHVATPSNGNAIFMVDTSGSLIWEATHPRMNYAFPADLRVIDSDNDGLADRIYAGDLGGQIWRVDFNDVTRSSEFRVAPLVDVSANGYQPFFYPPSVSLQFGGEQGRFFTLVIGSGNRDNPIADVSQGVLYLIDDEFGTDDPVETLVVSDLYNATAADLQSSNPSIVANAQDELDEKSGWFIKLNSGEKILSETLTLDNTVFATTFTPSAESSEEAGACATGLATVNRLMAVRFADAGPANTIVDESSAATNNLSNSRFRDISAQGIASQPQLVFNKDSTTAQLFVGKEDVVSIEPVLKKSMWYTK